MRSEAVPRAAVAAASRPSGAVHTRRTTCRICGGADLETILSLGPQPLANAFLSSPDEFAAEARFPLDTVFCRDCGLVQIVDVIDPHVLFGHYLYVTGTSETIAAHNRAFAQTVRGLLGLGGGDLVVEVASNDGSLLSCFRELGTRTLGVEPAANIAAQARERGIETVNRFFDGAFARELRDEHGPARVVIANNVLAHVDDPADFLRGAGIVIDDTGLVIVEVPYAGEMQTRVEYDTIYHEHLSYFAVSPLSRLARMVGLRIVRVDRIPVHGGSIRVYFARGDGDDPAVSSVIEGERDVGVIDAAAWQAFGAAARRNRGTMRELLGDVVASGASLAGYGAPAKGNTLLNFCGIGPELVPFTVDRNPLKVGRYTPGMHIPVREVGELDARRPDHVLLLPWNFAEEIMRQQQAHAARGGKWIIPVPAPRVV